MDTSIPLYNLTNKQLARFLTRNVRTGGGKKPQCTLLDCAMIEANEDISSTLFSCRAAIRRCWTSFTSATATTGTTSSQSQTSTHPLGWTTLLGWFSTTQGPSSRRTGTPSVRTCCSWCTSQRTSSCRDFSVKTSTWARRHARGPRHCHPSSRSPWSRSWRLWTSAIHSSSDVSSQMSTRSPWWVNEYSTVWCTEHTAPILSMQVLCQLEQSTAVQCADLPYHTSYSGHIAETLETAMAAACPKYALPNYPRLMASRQGTKHPHNFG